VSRYGPLLGACYDQADGSDAKAQCIGALSDACINTQDDGQSTLGMSQCLYSEAEYWDVLLNDEYTKTMLLAKESDQDDMEISPEYANRSKDLRTAQRAWITFRDAECELEYAIWGAGSMRNIAGSGCIMRLTAQRAIALREKRESMQ